MKVFWERCSEMPDKNRVDVIMNTFRLDKPTAEYVLAQTLQLIKDIDNKDDKPNRNEVTETLRRYFNLDFSQIEAVMDYAYGKSQDRDKANDYAVVHYLNNLAIALFEMVANYSNLPDTKAINRSYILITNEIKLLYARNPELEAIKESICWQSFDRLEHIENDIWDYKQYNESDYGISHNAQVNTLCILKGKETPEFTPELKNIIDEAEANGKAFHSILEEENNEEPNWFIPEYKLTYKIDGSIVINDVLTVKKTQSGLASDKLMTQAFQNEGNQFKPDFGKNYSRNLTTTLSGMGFKKNQALQQLFFPVASNSEGVVFRSSVTRDEAIKDRINTQKLDAQLKKLGARTEDRPFDMSQIPF